MSGPSDGIAAGFSTPALDTDLTLTCGQLTSHADNHASAATTANDASSRDTASIRVVIGRRIAKMVGFITLLGPTSLRPSRQAPSAVMFLNQTAMERPAPSPCLHEEWDATEQRAGWRPVRSKDCSSRRLPWDGAQPLLRPRCGWANDQHALAAQGVKHAMQARAARGMSRAEGARGEGRRSFRGVPRGLRPMPQGGSGGSHHGDPHLDDANPLLFPREVVRQVVGQVCIMRRGVLRQRRQEPNGDQSRNRKSQKPRHHGGSGQASRRKIRATHLMVKRPSATTS
jgi:hypothetical protein